MPSYSITFTTPEGPQGRRFSLDEEEPLRVQLPQIMEELAADGHLLRAGPEDEIAAFWNGQELDFAKSLRELGVTATRPLELRVRKRPIKSHQVLADAYFPKGSFAAMALAATAAAFAWGLGLLLTDLNDVVSNYADLDVLVASILGACVGASVYWFEAYRRFKRTWPQLLLGALIGAIGAGAGAAAGVGIHVAAGDAVSFGRSFLDRILAWILTGAGLGLALSLPSHGRRLSTIGLAVLVPTLGGLVGAIVFNLPGPSVLWQGLAFLTVGASVGYGITGLHLGASRALLEVEAIDRRAVGLLGARGIVLMPAVAVPLGALSRRGRVLRSGLAVAQFDGARVALQAAARPPGSDDPSSRVRVGGQTIDGSVLLGDGELIETGTTRYRLHVVGGASS